MKKEFKIILSIIIFFAVGGGAYLIYKNLNKPSKNISVNSFEECIAAGSAIMESYPRQCRYNDTTFVENIGNEIEKANLVHLENPRPNQTISSPLTVKGQARGFWFFEGSFPVFLVDWDGKIIAQGIAQAEGEWMTTEFVPFAATMTFVVDKNVYSDRGTLILKKDNPSDLPENDDAMEIPIKFAK